MRTITRRWPLVLVSIALVAIASPPAGAAWRTISDLNYDDGGRVCTDGMDMSFTEQGTDLSITVTDNTSNEELVPSTVFPLKFRPIPELFNEFIDYKFSANDRVLFSPQAEVGDEIQIDTDSAATGQSQTTEIVENCTVKPRFLGFYEVKNPPNVSIWPDVVDGNGRVRMRFSLHGDEGLDIFSEGPFRARVACSAGVPDPTVDTNKPAKGALSYRQIDEMYVYKWNPPDNLHHCHMLWFRTAYDGLTHRAIFDFGVSG
jgi:hypothetical protein